MLMRRVGVVVAVGAVVLAGCSDGAREEIGDAASEVADDVETAAEDAGDEVEEAAGEVEDEVEEMVDDEPSETTDQDDAAPSNGEATPAVEGDRDFSRPVPDQEGDFGEFTFGDVEYIAVARSCLDVQGDATVRTFEVVDGETNNVLHVVLVTADGTEWFVDVFNGLADDDEPPLAEGTGTGEQGDAERTNVDGTFEDGTPFSFSLVEIGPPNC